MDVLDFLIIKMFIRFMITIENYYLLRKNVDICDLCLQNTSSVWISSFDILNILIFTNNPFGLLKLITLSNSFYDVNLHKCRNKTNYFLMQHC